MNGEYKELIDLLTKLTGADNKPKEIHHTGAVEHVVTQAAPLQGSLAALAAAKKATERP